MEGGGHIWEGWPASPRLPGRVWTLSGGACGPLLANWHAVSERGTLSLSALFGPSVSRFSWAGEGVGVLFRQREQAKGATVGAKPSAEQARQSMRGQGIYGKGFAVRCLFCQRVQILAHCPTPDQWLNRWKEA